MPYTDFADELFARGAFNHAQTAGVRLASARKAGVTVTRVEILRDDLARPKGRYITLETPSVSVLDERDAMVIETAADQLRSLLPPTGKLLVVGVGNRRVTADALGPRTAQKVLVTAALQGAAHAELRAVCAVAPGVGAATGIPLVQLVRALVQEVQPVAVLCIDSLVSGEAARLGRTIQFSNTGLCPADGESAKHLTHAQLGVPVIAAGIPTLMDLELPKAAPQSDKSHEQLHPHTASAHTASAHSAPMHAQNLIAVPRALDDVVSHGAALLGAAINRAIHPTLSLEQLCWLAG